MTTKITYLPGDFTFINDDLTKDMLEDMYKAITETNTWEYVKADPGDGGFMLSGPHPFDGAIKNMDHSGASYAMTVRDMQYIARHGWDKYVSDTTANESNRNSKSKSTVNEPIMSTPKIDDFMDLWVLNATEPFVKGYIPANTDSIFTKNAYTLYLGLKNKEPVEKLKELSDTLRATPISYSEMRSFFG